MLDRLLLFCCYGDCRFILYPLISLIGRSGLKTQVYPGIPAAFHPRQFEAFEKQSLRGVSFLGAYHDRSFFIALHLYTSRKAEKDGKLPASYHDLAALCISAGVSIMLFGRRGLDYLWPASYQR